MFNQQVRELQPYVVSKRYDGRKCGTWLFLDWNETTYPLPNNVKERLKDAIDNGLGVSYPDGDCSEVMNAIKKFTGVSAQNILVFNGSDSALKDCIHCLLNPGDTFCVIDPEYSQVNTYVQMESSIVEGLRLPDPFHLNIDDVLKKLDGKKILYLSNPSNPTGRYLDRNEIIKLLDSGICLLLDEAYVEFAPESCADLVQSYTNLFIFRTFSKAFGLAGLRLGYLLAHARNIEVIKKYRNGKEINAFAQVAVVETLKNMHIFQKRITEIIHERDAFIKFINELDARIWAFNSTANFVVIKSNLMGALLEWLEDNRILIRDRRGMYFMDDCARVSIGTPEQMNRLKFVIKKFFEKL